MADDEMNVDTKLKEFGNSDVEAATPVSDNVAVSAPAEPIAAPGLPEEAVPAEPVTAAQIVADAKKKVEEIRLHQQQAVAAIQTEAQGGRLNFVKERDAEVLRIRQRIKANLDHLMALADSEIAGVETQVREKVDTYDSEIQAKIDAAKKIAESQIKDMKRESAKKIANLLLEDASAAGEAAAVAPKPVEDVDVAVAPKPVEDVAATEEPMGSEQVVAEPEEAIRPAMPDDEGELLPEPEMGVPETSGKTNMLAIISLLMAFIIPVVGMIIGIVAYNKLVDSAENSGKGLALAAIIIGAVLSLAIAAFLLI